MHIYWYKRKNKQSLFHFFLSWLLIDTPSCFPEVMGIGLPLISPERNWLLRLLGLGDPHVLEVSGQSVGFSSCFYACKKELSATSTHAWCRATARSSATSTHTWCYAGVGWGGMLTFIGTHTHTWCYATARSSATSTHTWCYATARSSATSTHTWCYATARSSATVLIRLRASWKKKKRWEGCRWKS